MQRRQIPDPADASGHPSYRRDARSILALGLPLIGSHLAQMAIHLTDSIMLGWFSIEALAAQVLAHMFFFSIFILGSGFAFAVMPMVATAVAAGDDTQVRRITRMGCWASLIYAALVLPLMVQSEALFLALDQNPQTAALAAEYLGIAGWVIVPALLVMVLKSYLAALERTQLVLWLTLAGVVLNAGVNYALIFGNLGFPEMGVRGAAIASLSVTSATLAALCIYVAFATSEHAMFQRVWRPDWEALRDVARLGWPIGVTNLLETGLFAASSIMMGWLGTVALAAHGIALQLVSLTFMVHLGMSNAATVRAGQSFGRRDRAALRRVALVAGGLSGAFAVIMAATFVLMPVPLMSVFLSPTDPDRIAVLAVGGGLLVAAAIFQLADAGQVMALGLLRAVRDTRAPMIIAGISYWIIGIPASYVLGFPLGLGGVGIWIGLAIGLALASTLLALRFWRWTGRWQPGV
ncbi:MATE family efflux transporter [Roseovarius dicentrarchi]|uniref:MATE family efflux transporter n=1 Tax=Roseovarius dicentrarchi TaxID=2250573 RepID=UPI000DE9A3A7|nr:MATE family efflux transporter [Roseovarius dicentrarchi]